MRRIVLVAAAAALISSLAVAGTAGAKPTPTYSAVLTVDGSCGFTLKASWSGFKVGWVTGQWYYGEAGSTFFATSDTRTNGAIRGRVATMTAGPAPVTSQSDWHVLTDFYAPDGTALVQMDSTHVPAFCGVVP